MEQVFENENTCDVFINEVKIEDEMFLKRENMVNFQSNKKKREFRNE